MPDLSAAVNAALVKYYEEVAEKFHKWVDPLSTEQLWTKPYPYGNTIGHLLLHVSGNLQDRIGAQVLGTPYKRNREKEFTDDSKPSKEAVLKGFDDAMEMVIDTIRKQDEAGWTAPYVALTGPSAPDRLSIFVRCLTHCNHHLGQTIYLAKELARTGETGAA